MGMRGKLILVLLFIGLVSAGTVGLVANQMVMRDFREVAREHAFEAFQEDFSGYLHQHPDWRSRLTEEDFNTYVQERHRKSGPRPDPMLGGPPMVDRWHAPPFKFLAMDSDGVVVKEAEGYPHGSMVPDSVMKDAVGITVGGKVVAYVSIIGDISLTPQDQRYLDAVNRSLLLGIGVACFLSAALGLIFGNSLSRNLSRLTQAIRKMYTSVGERQQLPVNTGDELGEVAQAFNEMNVELTKAHAELREMGIRDVLTGLYNRRHFDEQARQSFEQASRYNQPLSVMIGDLDHFKRINDGFSHAVGDEVLKEVGRLLLKTVRKSDVVARYGGEEFVVLFPNTTGDQAAISCEKVRSAIESHDWDSLQPGLAVTMSIGLCDDILLGVVDKMLTKADHRLYKAKGTGRNKVVAADE